MATSNIVHACTIIQCTLYTARAKCTANSNCKCQPEVRKGLKKTPLHLNRIQPPEGFTLKGGDYLLPWLTFLQLHWSTVLSGEYSHCVGDSQVCVSVSVSYVCPVASRSGTSQRWLRLFLFQISLHVKGAIFRLAT